MRDEEEDRQGLGLTHPGVAGTKCMQLGEFRHILRCAQGRGWFPARYRRDNQLRRLLNGQLGLRLSSASVAGIVKGQRPLERLYTKLHQLD